MREKLFRRNYVRWAGGSIHHFVSIKWSRLKFKFSIMTLKRTYMYAVCASFLVCFLEFWVFQLLSHLITEDSGQHEYFDFIQADIMP